METSDQSRPSNQERAYEFLSDIAEPQNYFCSVFSYIRGHSQLYVRAENTAIKDQPLFLAFESVRYFEGPMRWQGLDFRLGSIDERKNLLQGGWIDVGKWLDKFAGDNILFVLERSKYRVQIFAGSLYIGTTAPRIHVEYPDAPQKNQE